MYKIDYKKDKDGKITGINSIKIDGKDIYMMQYSEYQVLYNLYMLCNNTCYLEGYEAVTIYDKYSEEVNEQDLEIVYILQSDWLIDADLLCEDYAYQKLEEIDSRLEKLDDYGDNRFYNEYIETQRILYEYTRNFLKKYLKQIKTKEFFSHRKKKIIANTI